MLERKGQMLEIDLFKIILPLIKKINLITWLFNKLLDLIQVMVNTQNQYGSENVKDVEQHKSE